MWVNLWEKKTTKKNPYHLFWQTPRKDTVLIKVVGGWEIYIHIYFFKTTMIFKLFFRFKVLVIRMSRTDAFVGVIYTLCLKEFCSKLLVRYIYFVIFRPRNRRLVYIRHDVRLLYLIYIYVKNAFISIYSSLYKENIFFILFFFSLTHFKIKIRK